MSASGHSLPSHFVPVLNNVGYASDSDHSRYESELTLWAISDISHCRKSASLCVARPPGSRSQTCGWIVIFFPA
jgi:hypothetical protein